jgi:nucleoside-diphosphate-sugar epimerase
MDRALFADRRVLVTGAGGFIGRHLVADQLARGRRVVALDHHLDALARLDDDALRRIEADVCDRDRLRDAVGGVDTVFHLAAAHLSVSTDPAEFRRVNVEAVRELIDLCRDAEVRRFVHCSTVGVYGALTVQPADEETTCRPEYDYEVTKLEGEGVVLAAVRDHRFPAVILRPVWVYGPGCPRTEKLFRSIAKRRFVVAGRGSTRRHSLYVRDAVAALELAATAPDAAGEVIVVGEREATTVRDLVDRIARLTSAPRPPSVPIWALYGAGLAAEALFKPLGKEPPLSRRTLRFFTGNTSFRTEKARRVLGFEAAYSIESGLAETHAILQRGDFWSLPLPASTGAG